MGRKTFESRLWVNNWTAETQGKKKWLADDKFSTQSALFLSSLWLSGFSLARFLFVKDFIHFICCVSDDGVTLAGRQFGDFRRWRWGCQWPKTNSRTPRGLSHAWPRSLNAPQDRRELPCSSLWIIHRDRDFTRSHAPTLCGEFGGSTQVPMRDLALSDLPEEHFSFVCLSLSP